MSNQPPASSDMGSDPLVEWVRVPVLGLQVTPMTAAEVVAWIDTRPGKKLLLNHNLHSSLLFNENEEFARFYGRADRVVIDGAPVLWLAKRVSKQKLDSRWRIGSTDWIAELDSAAHGGTLAVYGATAEANDAAVAALTGSLSSYGWTVRGLNGYVSWKQAANWLAETHPDLVIIGLGMPKQEEFLQEYWNQLPEAVYATVGGAIDYVGGSNELAPRWVGRAGIEWLWRLAHEPRRLGYRYLVEPFKLLGILTRKRLRSRR